MLTGNPWLDVILKAVVWGLAAFLGAYLAQKGRHRALAEDFAQILRSTQSEAEAKKRGETEAVQKDLRLILDQLAQTTTLTKQIEAEMSHQVWDRQMRLNLKRDLYMRLLGAIGEKLRILQTLDLLENQLGDPRYEPNRREARIKKHRETCERNDELTREIQAVAAVSCVSLPDDAVFFIDCLSKRIQGESIRTANAPAIERMRAEAAVFQEGFNQLALFARRDLGDQRQQQTAQ